ncbi:MlaD family protein [Mycolicibacterium sp. XJ662]
MHLTRRIKVQLALFTIVALIAGAVMIGGYLKLPALLFGIGRYQVVLEMTQTAGLYPSANVTYRGTTVGEVTDVRLTPEGAEARLSLDSGIAIPSNLEARVSSVSAAGELYVALDPRDSTSAPLVNGDTIGRDHTSTPPEIGTLLNATSEGLQAIPKQQLRTVIDESYIAAGGLGPELTRIVRGSTQLAIDARQDLDAMVTLIDEAGPVLDSQSDTADEIAAWASHLASVTEQLRTTDSAVRGILQQGPSVTAEARHLIDRLQPTLPVLMANLVSVGQVAINYQPALEQLLVLLPQGVSTLQGVGVANHGTRQDYKGGFLDFNLNLNLPPPCTTGFLPAQQQRAPALTDYPDVPEGDVYCRVPQDSPFNVRGARNLPCLTVPGKRAPTVKMCESDEQYVPLNDGFNWKGDPNATLSGQDIPQLPPAASGPTLAATHYDPATGTYLGPDGRTYVQGDLGQHPPGGTTWQSMLVPPGVG